MSETACTVSVLQYVYSTSYTSPNVLDAETLCVLGGSCAYIYLVLLREEL